LIDPSNHDAELFYPQCPIRIDTGFFDAPGYSSACISVAFAPQLNPPRPPAVVCQVKSAQEITKAIADAAHFYLSLRPTLFIPAFTEPMAARKVFSHN